MNDELLNKKDESIFEKMILKEIKKHDVVIVSDYGHGLITKKLAKLLCKNSKFLALNAQVNASNTGYHSIQKYKGVDCVVINETELRQELRDKNEKLDILTKKLTRSIDSRLDFSPTSRVDSFVASFLSLGSSSFNSSIDFLTISFINSIFRIIAFIIL